MHKLLASLAGAIIFVSAPALAAPQAAAPAPSSPAQASDPAKLAEAHAILDVMLPADRRETTFEKLQTDVFAQMMPKLAAWMQDPGVKKILDDFIADAKVKQRAVIMKHMPEQLDAMATAYAHRFTLAELKDIDAFAHTPSGRHYLSESLSFMGDPAVAKANTAAMADIRSVTEALLPDFKAKLIAYVEAHPEVQAKIKAEGAPK